MVISEFTIVIDAVITLSPDDTLTQDPSTE
jgi:hypothetical protein